MLFPRDFSEMQVPEAALSQPIHTGAAPRAKSWPKHAKAPHRFFLARRVTGAGSPLTAPGPERGEAQVSVPFPALQPKHDRERKVGGNSLLEGGQEPDTHLPSSSWGRN